jgi:acetylornithine deacetylase
MASVPTLPSLREMVATLVGERSSSSLDPRFDLGNRRVVEHLAGWAEGLGMRVELLPSGGRADKVNLIATLGEGEGGLVLAGHTDTVPWDEARWSSDPFRLTERDGRLHGLGVSDMKSFFAVALAAIARLDRGRLRAPVVLLATHDEESTMAGARALVAAGRPRARFAVVGEPTGLRPVCAHKGAIMEVVRFVGQSGHSSDPSLGRSALEGVHELMGALIAHRERLAAEHRDSRFEVAVPTLNFGAVHGGDSPNRICGECELRFDLRVLPGMDVAAERDRLRAIAAEVAERRGLRLETPSAHPGTPAFAAPEDSALVRLTSELTGAEPMTVAFGTEAPYLAQLGAEVVVCGPGDIARAHQPDESIDAAALPTGVDLLVGLAQRLVGG